MQVKTLISGNINRKIWKAKTGDKIICKTIAEAKLICDMARVMNIKVSKRGAHVLFETEIDREKYLWTSGEPAKSTAKPSLGSVE